MIKRHNDEGVADFASGDERGDFIHRHQARHEVLTMIPLDRMLTTAVLHQHREALVAHDGGVWKNFADDARVFPRVAGFLPQLAFTCNDRRSLVPVHHAAGHLQRAHERGVKLVGATAHYVTSDLDEGPIIEQDVVRVTHATSVEEMTNLGREVEARVLARAVRWHVEHRTILHGSKTIVFS